MSRTAPDADEADVIKDHVEWKAVVEGFTLLQNDLLKLQVCILPLLVAPSLTGAISNSSTSTRLGSERSSKNGTNDPNLPPRNSISPDRWRCSRYSTVKYVYPIVHKNFHLSLFWQLITEFSDTVAACLLNLTDPTVQISATLQEELSIHNSVLNAQLMREPLTRSRVFLDLEDTMRRAVRDHDAAAVQHALITANELVSEPDGRTYIARILWKSAIDADTALADLILDSPNTPCDFKFVDDINGRTCMHEAAAAGALRLIDMCTTKGVEVNRKDSYGRTALHYAVIGGHVESIAHLLAAKADPAILDMDNFSCLYYAVSHGHLACVRLLLEKGNVGVEPTTQDDDVNPLSLACKHGHADIVLLLLERGAKHLPNSNGQYPIHLAAKAGHVEVCKLLVKRARETLDIPDKFNEWTPLFHAASEGRTAVVKVLLNAGCDVRFTDELGRFPIFYAGWYGHVDCVVLLLGASQQGVSGSVKPSKSSERSPTLVEDDADMETDPIPRLSLPPPIMPFRIYGHNYLDKQYLVQITLGRPHSCFNAAKPDIPVKINTWLSDYPPMTPATRPQSLLKMVMNSRPDTTAIPVSLTVPLSEDHDVVTFQVQDLSELSLEFSFYPKYGSKTIGRAAVLSSVFDDLMDSKVITLAILDRRLHIIGRLVFEACIIKPFVGATLSIGGAVETYWKSSSQFPVKEPGVLTSNTSAVDSTHTSPSTHSALMNPSGSMTITSLSQDFITVVVQGTRDLVPVIYTEWILPIDDLSVGVSDVTSQQFAKVASKTNRKLDPARPGPSANLHQWAETINNSMITLEALLTVGALSRVSFTFPLSPHADSTA